MIIDLWDYTAEVAEKEEVEEGVISPEEFGRKLRWRRGSEQAFTSPFLISAERSPRFPFSSGPCLPVRGETPLSFFLNPTHPIHTHSSALGATLRGGGGRRGCHFALPGRLRFCQVQGAPCGSVA